MVTLGVGLFPLTSNIVDFSFFFSSKIDVCPNFYVEMTVGPGKAHALALLTAWNPSVFRAWNWK